MKKQLLSIGLAALVLAMTAGTVQAKEIKNPPPNMQKPAIQNTINKQTNYRPDGKYLTSAQKKHNSFTNQKYKNKYGKKIAKAPKNKHFWDKKNKKYNKQYFTAQNRGNQPNFNLQKKPTFNGRYGV